MVSEYSLDLLCAQSCALPRSKAGRLALEKLVHLRIPISLQSQAATSRIRREEKHLPGFMGRLLGSHRQGQNLRARFIPRFDIEAIAIHTRP